MRRSHLAVLLTLTLCFQGCRQQAVIIELKNPLDEVRSAELIRISRDLLASDYDPERQLHIYDRARGTTLPYQLMDLDQDGVWEDLIFQVTLQPEESKLIHVEQSGNLLPANDPKVFGRLVPERKDDFAWENDRIAFRMYGPALEKSGEVSSGVDVWAKSVTDLIIDSWYATDDYHVDHGEGADFYKVGPTLGCGGLGILWQDSLYTSKNFSDARILAAGPLRFVFELDYAPWGPPGSAINETKRISLDAGSFFNRMDVELRGTENLPPDAHFVTGIIHHQDQTQTSITSYQSDHYSFVYEGLKGNNGSLGTAVISDPVSIEDSRKPRGDHLLRSLGHPHNNSLSYHAGAAWSKSPWINSELDWQDLVKQHAQFLQHPIKMTIRTHNQELKQ